MFMCTGCTARRENGREAIITNTQFQSTSYLGRQVAIWFLCAQEIQPGGRKGGTVSINYTVQINLNTNLDTSVYIFGSLPVSVCCWCTVGVTTGTWTAVQPEC